MLVVAPLAEAFPQLAVAVWVVAVPVFEFVAHARPLGSIIAVVEVENTATVGHRGGIGALDLIKERPGGRTRHAVNVSGSYTARSARHAHGRLLCADVAGWQITPFLAVPISLLAGSGRVGNATSTCISGRSPTAPSC